MGKESEKEYIHVQLNHFAVHLKLTQHCQSTIFEYKIKSTLTQKNQTFSFCISKLPDHATATFWCVEFHN